MTIAHAPDVNVYWFAPQSMVPVTGSETKTSAGAAMTGAAPQPEQARDYQGGDEEPHDWIPPQLSPRVPGYRS